METKELQVPNVTTEEVLDAVESKIDKDDRDLLSTSVRNDLKEIIQGLVESAKGMWVQKTVINKLGVEIEVPVYQKEPDTNDAQYLLNQLIGKPKETQVNLGIKNNIIIQWKQ